MPCEDTEARRQPGEAEVEVGVMLLQARGCLEPPGWGGEKPKDPPLQRAEGAGPRPHLDFGLLASRMGDNEFL